MLDTSDYPLTLSHGGTCSQGNRVAFFAAFYSGVGLMGIAPGSASVNERLELAGNISPV